jgi:aspartate aminotransferase
MFFENLEVAPLDPIFGLEKTFKLDPRKEKQYLCVGAYQDELMNMPIFGCVQKAKKLFLEMNEVANYLPFEGLDTFNMALGQLLFGSQWEEMKYCTYIAEALGGTGALRIGAEFIGEFITENAFVSNPTWPNHFQVLKKANLQVAEYPYLSRNFQVDFDQMLAFISKIPSNSLVILQACCHNPTGADLSQSEWNELSSLMMKKRLIPFFDIAYHGLGRNLIDDTYAIRYFAKQGHEMLVSYTCSKNFSLYCHRTGALFIVANSSSRKEAISSQVNRIIRANYSNPPMYGAMLVSLILNNDKLKQLWEKEVNQIQARLNSLRQDFVKKLNQNFSDKNFNYILKHNGMFSFLDLNKEQVLEIREKFGVYLSKNGRMNFAGLNKENMQFIVDSITKVLR